MEEQKPDYRIKTVKVLNKLIKARGLDVLIGKLEENNMMLKLIITFGIVIGIASLGYVAAKLIFLILEAPFLVYLVTVTVAFSMYLMIAIENQPMNKVEKADDFEENEKSTEVDEDKDKGNV